jgi:hypothetical protein
MPTALAGSDDVELTLWPVILAIDRRGGKRSARKGRPSGRPFLLPSTPTTWKGDHGEWEIQRRLTTEAERRHAQSLEALHNEVELAKAVVSGIAEVTETAMFETLKVNMVRNVITQIDPDGASEYEFLARIGQMQMAKAIGRGQ